MVLPIHDVNPVRRTPVVTYLLVLANVVAFLLSPVAATVTGSGSAAAQCRQLAFFDEFAAKPDEVKAKKHDAFDGLAKLVDHPLVADLLAAGAIAAVAAIAEHQLDKKGQSSSKMVKSVGKAAAAAMGKRLFGDISAVTEAAVDAAKKA